MDVLSHRVSSPQVSRSTGYFELQLMSVGNPAGQLLNGDCCDAERSASEGSCGPDECDTYFRVCLKEYQTEVTTNGACTYGSETTKVLGGNTFQFRGGQKSGQNRNSDAGRILIPFQFAWPVSGRRRTRAAAAGARAPGSRRRCVQGHGHQLEKCSHLAQLPHVRAPPPPLQVTGYLIQTSSAARFMRAAVLITDLYRGGGGGGHRFDSRNS